MPKVLNIRTHGFPKGAFSVMRPGLFGNPYVIGPDGDRDEVIRLFEIYFLERLRLDAKFKEAALRLKDATFLVCCCAPLDCHADVISRWLQSVQESSL